MNLMIQVFGFCFLCSICVPIMFRFIRVSLFKTSDSRVGTMI